MNCDELQIRMTRMYPLTRRVESRSLQGGVNRPELFNHRVRN